MRRRAAALALAACLSGCVVPAPEPTTSPTASGSSAPAAEPEATFPQNFPVPDGLLDGGAQRVAERLHVLSQYRPAIKLDVTASQVVLVVLLPDRSTQAYRWRDGVIEQVNSDVRWSKQATFDPTDYPLGDVRRIFDVASLMGATGQEPMLQVAEYRDGEILLTVTTRPETQIVFFRPDGRAIRRLGTTSAADITEGLASVTERQPTVLALGFSPARGYWADVPAGEGQVERRTRTQHLPRFTSRRNENSQLEPFAPGLVDPVVIAQLLSRHRSEGEECGVEVDNRHQRTRPVIRYECAGRVKWADLQGRDMTDQFG